MGSEKSKQFVALRANPTSPTACLPENWWVRGCAPVGILGVRGCMSADGEKINVDVFLRLLTEFGLAVLVGQKFRLAFEPPHDSSILCFEPP